MRFLLLVIIMFSATCAKAERRVAFLVGNADYAHAPSLDNPVRDTELIGQTLTDLGFAVTLKHNLNRLEIGRELSQFLRAESDADVTLFYFAGHGMQYEGRNYLIGTNARLETEFDIPAEALELDRVISLIERQSKAALVFVDACRDNPLADAFYAENLPNTRNLSRVGLAPMNSAFDGAMVTFSASPGQVAFDGEGAHSPFAQALARHLPTPNLEVLSLMKRVIKDVREATQRLQTPMVTNDLTAEIYLKTASISLNGQRTGASIDTEEALYTAARNASTISAWNLYLSQYPNGRFVETARAARAALAAELAPPRETPATLSLDKRSVPPNVRAAPLTPARVRAVQQRLNIIRYTSDRVSVDGVMGDQTRSKIMEVQNTGGVVPTGLLSRHTLNIMGLQSLTPEIAQDPYVSGASPEVHDPADIALREFDTRIVKAAEVFEGTRFSYGYFDGSVYLIVETNGASVDEIAAVAESFGGKLASIDNERENWFLYGMVRNDPDLWITLDDSRYAAGVAFGLKRYGTDWRWSGQVALRFAKWINGARTRAHPDAAYAHFEVLKNPSVVGPTGRIPSWGFSIANPKAVAIEIN